MTLCARCGAEILGTFCASCGAEPTRENAPHHAAYRHAAHPQYIGELPLSVGDWIITLLVTAIPCIGFIMLIVWAASSSGNTSRRNYSRAVLLLMAILAALFIVANVLFVVVGVTTLNSLAL